MAEASDRRSSVRSLRICPSIGSLINMVMSILHRITGAALYFGTLLLAAWLIAAAMGEAQFATRQRRCSATRSASSCCSATPGRSIHHMLGGMRHFIWDTGRGFADLAGQPALVADDHRLRRR